MKHTKSNPVWIALLLLVLASLACNVASPAGPSASNFYMSKDQDGEQRTTVFAPTDDFYVQFDVSGIEAGTNFQSRWYALDVEGQDPNTPFQAIDYPYEDNIGHVYFQLTNADAWPVGSYKVEVYMNDTKVGEQTFTVQ